MPHDDSRLDADAVEKASQVIGEVSGAIAGQGTVGVAVTALRHRACTDRVWQECEDRLERPLFRRMQRMS